MRCDVGLADAFVPSDHALHLVAGLPRCRAWFDPGEGHFFFRRRVREILAQLAPSRRGVATGAPSARQRLGQAISFVSPGSWQRSVRAGPLPWRIVIVVTLVM